MKDSGINGHGDTTNANEFAKIDKQCTRTNRDTSAERTLKVSIVITFRAFFVNVKEQINKIKYRIHL